MALTVEGLALAMRVTGSPDQALTSGQTEDLTRLLSTATSLVGKYAGPGTPGPTQEYAVILVASYLYDKPHAPRRLSFAAIWANSGAASLCEPWRVRRAAPLSGDTTGSGVPTPGGPGVDQVARDGVQRNAGWIAGWAERARALIESIVPAWARAPNPPNPGGTVDQLARDAAALNARAIANLGDLQSITVETPQSYAMTLDAQKASANPLMLVFGEAVSGQRGASRYDFRKGSVQWFAPKTDSAEALFVLPEFDPVGALRTSWFPGTTDEPSPTVQTKDIFKGSITGALIAADAIGSGQLGADAVSTETVQDGAITLDKLASEARQSAGIRTRAFLNVRGRSDVPAYIRQQVTTDLRTGDTVYAYTDTLISLYVFTPPNAWNVRYEWERKRGIGDAVVEPDYWSSANSDARSFVLHLDPQAIALPGSAKLRVNFSGTIISQAIDRQRHVYPINVSAALAGNINVNLTNKHVVNFDVEITDASDNALWEFHGFLYIVASAPSAGADPARLLPLNPTEGQIAQFKSGAWVAVKIPSGGGGGLPSGNPNWSENVAEATSRTFTYRYTSNRANTIIPADKDWMILEVSIRTSADANYKRMPGVLINLATLRGFAAQRSGTSFTGPASILIAQIIDQFRQTYQWSIYIARDSSNQLLILPFANGSGTAPSRTPRIDFRAWYL